MDENQPRMKNQKIELRAHDERYTFDVQYKKPVRLGRVEVVQIWMDPKTVYSQRRGNKPPAHNHQELLRCFWDTVVARGESDNREAQEKYLHAALTPVVPSNHSRDVFEDASPKDWKATEKTKGTKQDSPILALDKQLRESRSERLTIDEFSNQVSWLLQPHYWPVDFGNKSLDINSQLFDEPCRLLQLGEREAAMERLRTEWGLLLDDYYPHRKPTNDTALQVLKALAYEAKAAMNSVHSTVWEMMIGTLHAERRISVKTATFLRLWHCDLVVGGCTGAFLHGSLFATHPATAMFMQTPTGPELLGEWLQTVVELPPNSTDSGVMRVPMPGMAARLIENQRVSLAAFEQFLHGLLVAISAYTSHLEQSRQAGKEKQRSQSKSKQPVMVGAGSAQSTNAEETCEAGRASETFDREDPYRCAVVFLQDRGLTKDGNADDIRQAIESQFQRMGYNWKLAHVFSARTSGPRNMQRLRQQLSDARESFDLLLIDVNNALVESADDTSDSLEELGVQVRSKENYR